MPHTISGIGTRFYGKDEIGQLGTYLVTEWIVFLYIPIVPIGSFRVRLPEKFVSDKSPQRAARERVSLQWQHICNVYAFIAAIAILTYLLTNRRATLASLFTGRSFAPAQISSDPSSSAVLDLPVAEEPLPPEPAKPAYERPTTAENGKPFPETSGYIEGYEQAFIDGNTILTVDNAENNYDLYVKLYNLDATPLAIASVFFVKADDEFTIETIKPGTYELRYQNLASGDQFRTDSFALKEKLDRNSGAPVFDHLTLSLYGAIDGDMEIYPIEKEDF